MTVDCGITANRRGRAVPGAGHRPGHHRPPRVQGSELPQAMRRLSTRTGRTRRSRVTELAGVGVAFKLACRHRAASRKRFWIATAIFSASARLRTSMPLTGREPHAWSRRGLKALREPAARRHCGPDPANAPCRSGAGHGRHHRLYACPAHQCRRTHGRGRNCDRAVSDARRGTRGRVGGRALPPQPPAAGDRKPSIYQSAVAMLPPGGPPQAIVLADESWHQGVVGIVASRMAEEYSCPTFLDLPRRRTRARPRRRS